MIKHDFQPINNESRFKQALEYVADNVIGLGKTVLGKEMTLDTLTLFTHHDDEFEALEPIVRKFGPESEFTHGLTLYIEPLDLEVAGFAIKYLGLRRPDATRVEVGYGDFITQDTEKLFASQGQDTFIKRTKSG